MFDVTFLGALLAGLLSTGLTWLAGLTGSFARLLPGLLPAGLLAARLPTGFLTTRLLALLAGLLTATRLTRFAGFSARLTRLRLARLLSFAR